MQNLKYRVKNKKFAVQTPTAIDASLYLKKGIKRKRPVNSTQERK